MDAVIWIKGKGFVESQPGDIKVTNNLEQAWTLHTWGELRQLQASCDMQGLTSKVLLIV